MPEEEDVNLRRAVLQIIVYSKGVVTCQEIKEGLNEQKSLLYSEEEMMQAINSISAKRKDQLEFIIVTREGKPEFGIMATEKFWD